MYTISRFKLNYLVPLILLALSGCIRNTVDAPCLNSEVSASTARVVQAIELQTLYGNFVIQEPVIIDLLVSQAMQRLKHIHQHGINDVVKPEYAFSRYDHSVGVFILTRMYGASLEEQVAALLHDVSHTVFSHVGDLVFAAPSEIEASSSYQDDIHEWFVEQTDLAAILRSHNMRHVVTDAAKDSFKRLEQEYPDICADRLDYQLRTAHIAGLLSEHEVHEILNHLHFEDDKWFFDDLHVAQNFGIASELLTRYIYAAPYNHYLYKVAADAFKRAMEIGLVSAHELHFSTDDVIWDRMQQADDQQLRALLNLIDTYKDAYALSDASDYDYFKKSKCRVVNPLVKHEGAFVRLTDADAFFAQVYDDIQYFCNAGVYLKFKADEVVAHA